MTQILRTCGHSGQPCTPIYPHLGPRKNALQYQVLELTQLCSNALNQLDAAISAEKLDAFTDNNGLIGCWASNRSWNANMQAANTLDRLSVAAAAVNQASACLRSSGCYLPQIMGYLDGHSVRQAEQNEHGFFGRLFDLVSGNNMMDGTSSMHTLNQLNRSRTQVEMLSMQVNRLSQELDFCLAAYTPI